MRISGPEITQIALIAQRNEVWRDTVDYQIFSSKNLGLF